MIAYKIQLRYVIRGKIPSETNSVRKKKLLGKKLIRKKLLSEKKFSDIFLD